MIALKKLGCAALAAAMLLAAGCSTGDTTWVYQSGEAKMPAGLYRSYMISTASSAEAKIGEANKDNSAYEGMAYKKLLKETLEEQTVSQWIAAETLQRSREYFAIEQKFDELGLTLSEAQQASVKTAAAGSWNEPLNEKETYGQYYERNGIAQPSIQLQLANNIKRSLVFTTVYSEGGELAVPETEITGILTKDYALVDYMLFPKAVADKTDDAGTTVSADDQNAARKTEAEGYLARLKGGEAILDLILEQQKAEAGEHADEVGALNPEDWEMVLSQTAKASNPYISDELLGGALSASVGEAVLVEDTNFYFILSKKDVLADPDLLAAYRSEILQEMKAGEFADLVRQWAAGVEMTPNDAAVKQYRPESLKIK